MSQTFKQFLIEGESTALVYRDMAGDGDQLIAFADEWDYDVVIEAMDAIGEGAAYPGGARSTFDLESGIKPPKVVPSTVIKEIDRALDTEIEEEIEEALEGINDYFFTDENYLKESEKTPARWRKASGPNRVGGYELDIPSKSGGWSTLGFAMTKTQPNTHGKMRLYQGTTGKDITVNLDDYQFSQRQIDLDPTNLKESANPLSKGTWVAVADLDALKGEAKHIKVLVDINGKRHNKFIVAKTTPKFATVVNPEDYDSYLNAPPKYKSTYNAWRVDLDNLKPTSKRKLIKDTRGDDRGMMSGMPGR